MTGDIAADLAALVTARTAALDETATGPPDPPAPQWLPFYGSVEEWVADAFTTTYLRRSGSSAFTWCPSWWAHPEAVIRLEALWRSWESLRRDPHLGMATWLAQHLDHHLPILTSPAGPFARCHPTHHDHDPARLALTPPPPGWWDTHTPTGDTPQERTVDGPGA